MDRSPRPAFMIALLIFVLLAASACSSGSDSADGSIDGDTNDTQGSASGDSSEEPESAAALTCDDAAEPSALIRGANGWLGQVVSPETEEIAGDYDALLAAIETLRPIQDIDGLFGTMREGLDNMEADIIAVQEGRYDDKVGEYGVVAMNAVIGEEICGG